MSVSVKYGRDRLSFAIPDPTTPVSAIRQSLADYTGLPYDGFKLIHKGAVIRDDNAPIAAYNITTSSVLQLIPTNHEEHYQYQQQQQQPQQQQPVQVAPPTTSGAESAVLHTIHTELATVRSSLTPALNNLLLRVSSSNQATSDKDRKEFLRIGELLLQSLLRLDAIVPDREWDTARAERRAAVKEVQGLLDTLDDTVTARRAEGLHN